MDQPSSEFLIEIEELVEQVFADLDELRAIKTEGKLRRELIDRIFRRVHSVKGSAASCGLAVVSDLAHEFENLLDEVRSGRIVVDDKLLDTFGSATDALSESLSLAASGGAQPSRWLLLNRLQAAARGAGDRSAGGETILENIPSEIWASLTEPEKQRLTTIVAEGQRLFVVTTSFDIADFDRQFFHLKKKLAESGEVVSTSPAVDDHHPERINFRVLYASEAHSQTKDFVGVTFEELKNPGTSGH